MYTPHDIHNWKAMDRSFFMVFSKRYFVDPTGRQNFGDAPGQIPKLILTLCHKMYFQGAYCVVSIHEKPLAQNMLS